LILNIKENGRFFVQNFGGKNISMSTLTEKKVNESYINIDDLADSIGQNNKMKKDLFVEYENYPRLRILLVRSERQKNHNKVRVIGKFCGEYNSKLKQIDESDLPENTKDWLLGLIKECFISRLFNDIQKLDADEKNDLNSYIKARWRDYTIRKKDAGESR